MRNPAWIARLLASKALSSRGSGRNEDQSHETHDALHGRTRPSRSVLRILSPPPPPPPRPAPRPDQDGAAAASRRRGDQEPVALVPARPLPDQRREPRQQGSQQRQGRPPRAPLLQEVHRQDRRRRHQE